MMPIRSLGKKTATYVASAALVSLLIIVASTLYVGLPATTSPSTASSTTPSALSLGSSSSSTSTSVSGPQSLLVVQLTDPPQVPEGTRSLNLTYTALALVVGEPSGNGKVNPTTVNLTPTGGSATLNLLRLQNISQTIASTNLPNGSIIYSVTFTVSSITINLNGTVTPVTLATGGNTFSVTISQPTSLKGENVALLELNPIIVGTPSGYQLIPSSVGVIKHSEGQGEEQVGWQHQLTPNDTGELQHARGNLTANMVSLSVSGNTTSVTVQVRNTGSAAVELNAIGLHGNFTTTGSECSTNMFTTTFTHGSSTHTQTQPGPGNEHRMCQLPELMNEVVFIPVAPTTSTTSKSTTVTSTTAAACTTGKMELVNGGGGDQGNERGFALQAGQCVNFAFSGTITFGESANVLIPSTLAGQTYDVHVIASFGANLQLTCTLPLGANSCKVDTRPGFFDFGPPGFIHYGH